VSTTREPVDVDVDAQELDFAILYESQLLEKLLQFADEAVRCTLVSCTDLWRDRSTHWASNNILCHNRAPQC